MLNVCIKTDDPICVSLAKAAQALTNVPGSEEQVALLKKQFCQLLSEKDLYVTFFDPEKKKR